MASSFLPPSLTASSSVAPPSLMYACGGRINSSLLCNSTMKRRCRIGTSNVVDESMISGAAAPWLMVPPTGKGVYSFYNLTEKKVVNLEPKGLKFSDMTVVGSTDGFLILYDEYVDELFLYNPISGRRIDLPFIIRTNPDIPHGILGCPNAAQTWKVVISDDESRALMMFGATNRLAFCNPSRSIEWIELGPTLKGYTDIVYSKRHKRFICTTDSDLEIVYSKRHKRFICTTDSDLEEWDLRLRRKPKNLVPEIKDIDDENERQDFWWSGFVDVMTDDDMCQEEPYVVFAEHTNQLYVVCRHLMKRTPYLENRHKDGFPVREDWDENYAIKTIGFDVYKVVGVGDGDDVEFRPIEGSLDNLVMFIGVNHSFALRADDYPELKPDSIYFTDHPRHFDWQWRNGGIFDTPHDSAIYNFKDRTFLSLDYPNHVSKDSSLWCPLWLTPSTH